MLVVPAAALARLPKPPVVVVALPKPPLWPPTILLADAAGLKENDEATIPKGEVVILVEVVVEGRDDPRNPAPNAGLPVLALEEKGEQTPKAGFVVDVAGVDDAAAWFLLFIVVVPTEGMSFPVSSSIIPQFDIVTLFNGRWVFWSVFNFSISYNVSIPSITSPNTTCLPFKYWTGLNVKKNWDEFVFFPEFAILSKPFFEWFIKPFVSSLNLPHPSPCSELSSYIDWPPRPSPVV